MNEKIDRDFTYHAPTPDSIEKMQNIRGWAKSIAYLIDESVPDSREKSLALTNLEQAVMWANAGIARNQAQDPNVITPCCEKHADIFESEPEVVEECCPKFGRLHAVCGIPAPEPVETDDWGNPVGTTHLRCSGCDF